MECSKAVCAHRTIYLCQSATRLSSVNCFSLAFPINSCCCLLHWVISFNNGWPCSSLFMSEDRAFSLELICSIAW